MFPGLDSLGSSGVALWLALASTAGVVVAMRRPDLVVRRARLVLGILVVITLMAAGALVDFETRGLRLRIDPSTEALLPTGDPQTSDYRQAIRDFGDDEVYIIALSADDVFSREHLLALRRVGDSISRLPGVRSVQSLDRVTSFRYVRENDWIEVGDFIQEIPSQTADLSDLRARALSDSIFYKTLVGPGADALAINVTFRKMTDAEFIDAGLDGRIRDLLLGETTGQRRFHVSGRPHIKSVMYASMTRDLSILIPAAIFVIAVVLGIFSRSPAGVLLPLLTVLTAILWTFGLIARLDVPLTVLTVLLAPTLVAIGGGYGLHVVNRFEERAATAPDLETAVVECLERTRLPVLVAGITTMLGFAALLTTDVRAVVELGVYSVFGVASVTALALLGIPAALCWMRPRGNRAAGSVSLRLHRSLTNLARLPLRHSGAVLLFWTLLVGLAVLAIPQLSIDTDYLSYFDEDAEVRREFEAIDKLLAGAVPLFLILDGGQPGALREPEALKAMERVQRGIDALPGVSRTVSFLGTVRSLNRATEQGDPRAERIPETRAGVTELLFMIPKGTLQRFATVDHSRANVIVRTGAVGSAAMREVVSGIWNVVDRSELARHFSVQLTGNAILLNRAADGVARAQPRTVGLAALAIFALLSASLRSPRLGLVAMIPNLVPIVLFYGLLGLGAAPLSLPTSLIGSIALGIAIDATAHYLARYREERRSGLDPEAAVLRCGEAVGRPITIGALMLAIGFATICLSEFATLREFGMLASFTMVVCALTDLVLLPAILVRLRI